MQSMQCLKLLDGAVVRAPCVGSYLLEPDVVPLKDPSPVIRDFLRIWAAAASCETHRSNAIGYRGDKRAARGTLAQEAARAGLLADFGKARLNALFEIVGPAFGRLRVHAALVCTTADRTYGEGTPEALTAAWMAPPIDSPVIPDVAMALKGARTARTQDELQALFDKTVRWSLGEAEGLMAKMLGAL